MAVVNPAPVLPQLARVLPHPLLLGLVLPQQLSELVRETDSPASRAGLRVAVLAGEQNPLRTPSGELSRSPAAAVHVHRTDPRLRTQSSASTPRSTLY